MESGGSYVEVEGVTSQLEGAARPHFFRGVATVVAKLLNAVQVCMGAVGVSLLFDALVWK